MEIMRWRWEVNIESSPSGCCKPWQRDHVSLIGTLQDAHTQSTIARNIAHSTHNYNRSLCVACRHPLYQKVSCHDATCTNRRFPRLALGPVQHQHAAEVNALVALPVQWGVPREGELCLREPPGVAALRVHQPPLRDVAHDRLLAASVQRN
jgi:hypothetical protein